MGWKESGKYGVSTGRTVRSPFADAHGFSCRVPGQETEILLKFTRGTEKFSSSEMDEFLAENDIGDGLDDFAESSQVPFRARNSVHRSSIPYSLKKRKRWRLPELAEKNSLELNDSEERPKVTFVHRRMQKELDADCIAIKKTKQNEVFTPRKRKYTHYKNILFKLKLLKNPTERPIERLAASRFVMDGSMENLETGFYDFYFPGLENHGIYM